MFIVMSFLYHADFRAPAMALSGVWSGDSPSVGRARWFPDEKASVAQMAAHDDRLAQRSGRDAFAARKQWSE
jgi:hypothetical protein